MTPASPRLEPSPVSKSGVAHVIAFVPNSSLWISKLTSSFALSAGTRRIECDSSKPGEEDRESRDCSKQGIAKATSVVNRIAFSANGPVNQ